ncbi:MAG: 3-hydroxyacyl-CoA dehydrogenase NAD-binding domain-containing protein [Candidatus Omnitrophota bacterium]
MAGADIQEIEHITAKDDAKEKAEKGKEVLDRLAALDFVTVSVINGACLGGGLELALACKHRVASFSDKVKIGLPEVKLGIIPGFAGTQRLPRLIGLTQALTMILAGKIVSGTSALKSGLVDRLFPDVGLVDSAIEFAKERIAGKAKKSKKKKKLLQKILEDTPFGRKLVFSQAKKNVLKTTKGFYPAPLAALDVLRRTYGRDPISGSRIESEVFSELAVTDVSKSLIKVFYLIEEFKKLSWVGPEIKPEAVGKCAIVGAGVMGGGIAQLLSFRDIPTRMKDINYDALKTALKTAYGLFEYALKKRKLKQHDFTYKFGLISPTVTYKGFENADMVIEAVVENLKVKQGVFKELGAITRPDTVLASNTSSLPILQISEETAHPERVVGLHFFNPVHRMPLIEIIRSKKTDDRTMAATIAFARRIGKTVIVVNDVPGFLINRILLSYLNESGFLLEEGVPMERIDAIARDFGMPMGPVELIDEVGIDVGYKVARILEESYGARMKVCSVLEKVKSKGLLGKKAEKGFYIHKGKKRTPNKDIYSIAGISRARRISDEEILKRLMYVMINEAARCLEENVVDRPETVDIGMIMGTGFPPFRAGLLRYADTIGAEAIASGLKKFETELKSERFAPCGRLLAMAKNGEKFYK